MPRYRLTTVSGDKFTVESRDDHAAVVKELLAKGFLFGTREDSTGDAEAILARNVISVGVVAGTQLFALPEFRFEPPARKSAATPPRAAKKTTAKAKKKR
jgi:hypothetical protein